MRLLIMQNLGFAVPIRTYLEWFGKVNRKFIKSTVGCVPRTHNLALGYEGNLR
jgi:hypothetical protein